MTKGSRGKWSLDNFQRKTNPVREKNQTAKTMEIIGTPKCKVLWKAGVRIDTEDRAHINSTTVKLFNLPGIIYHSYFLPKQNEQETL